jgi:hypothetical protein
MARPRKGRDDQLSDGKLLKRARENEFAELTADEVEQIEELYHSSFSAKGGGDATA